MQKKVLLIGAGPLPSEKEGIRDAAGLRTEQFLSPLKKGGYEVYTVLIGNKSPVIAPPAPSLRGIPLGRRSNSNSQYDEAIHANSLLISRSDAKLFRQVRQVVQNFSPDVCIAVNTFPSFVAAKTLPRNIPFWADLNGWIMAESQVRANEIQDNRLIPNAWEQEKTILQRADKISTVSTPQKFATIGELATLGRLTGENTGYDLVISIPNATKVFSIDAPTGEPLFRGRVSPLPGGTKGGAIPQNAIVLAWIGGYNNWVDEEALFTGLENAMKKEENLYFVSTGGNIDNIATGVFGRFLERIKSSKYKDRFVFLGWIATEDMAKVYTESDIGICTDIWCTETETGARNRLNEMMKFGLPIITTEGSEIAEVIEREECGLVSKSGKSDELTENILKLCQDKALREKLGENGKKVVLEVHTEDTLFTPVEAFLKSPKTAPDRNFSPLDMNGGIWSKISSALLYARQNGIKALFGKIQQYLPH